MTDTASRGPVQIEAATNIDGEPLLCWQWDDAAPGPSNPHDADALDRLGSASALNRNITASPAVTPGAAITLQPANGKPVCPPKANANPDLRARAREEAK